MTRSRELAELASAYDSGNSLGFRNRIINGDCRIDQRRSGAALSPAANGDFLVDRMIYSGSQANRFFGGQNYNSVTPPAGFTNYAGVQCSTAQSLAATDNFRIIQRIEGFNVADLAWGSASAQSATLSFRVYSSLTGTFGGALTNSASNRSYPFTYTVSSANTWTTVSVTIPGDTSGTWLTTNGIGIAVNFSLGTGSTYSGTAGAWSGSVLLSATGAVSVVGTQFATFNITGVQLEAGTVATPFERRDYGRELIMCQRYFQRFGFDSINARIGSGAWASSTNAFVAIPLLVSMRASPVLSSPNRGRVVLEGVNWYNCTVAVITGESTNVLAHVSLNVTASAAVSGQVAVWGGGGALAVDAQFSAEL